MKRQKMKRNEWNTWMRNTMKTTQKIRTDVKLVQRVQGTFAKYFYNHLKASLNVIKY